MFLKIKPKGEGELKQNEKHLYILGKKWEFDSIYSSEVQGDILNEERLNLDYCSEYW